MIGDIIRQARQNQNLSQKELAELTGLTQTGISKIELGISGSNVKTLRRIADTLGIQNKLFPQENYMIDDEIDMNLEKRVERRVETRLEARLEARLESRLKEDITND
ncbi:MAG TPA: helix-turn-helix transcriptional regulator, partial [Planctomycetota bacterium]|nr:helix-turn-helix transcriptional regulator [Planctomycetota bacterium]